MGWLSTLAKIGLVGAAPFTGGASLGALPIVNALSGGANSTPPSDGAGGGLGGIMQGIGSFGQVLGKQQEGAATGRNTQAQTQQGQDRNAISLYQAQNAAENAAAQTDLQRKEYSDKARSHNTKTSVISHLLAGGMPQSSVSMPGVTAATMHGGPLEALKNNPEALAALTEAAKQADSGMTNPAAFVGGNTVKAPGMTPLPQESKTGGFLDALSRIAQIAGTVSPYLMKSGDNS